MYVLRLQTSIVWFLSPFSEGLMCMRQNFKLICCAAYILNLIVSVCLSCWPNLWYSGVFSAEFRSFRKNSAEPDISRKYGSASRIFLKIRLRGLRTLLCISRASCLFRKFVLSGITLNGCDLPRRIRRNVVFTCHVYVFVRKINHYNYY